MKQKELESRILEEAQYYIDNKSTFRATAKKFELGAEDDLVRDFQKENHILLDAEKQIQKKDRQKEWEMEL